MISRFQFHIYIYIYSCTGFVLIRDTEVPGNSLTACRPISTGRVLSFSRLLPPNPPPLRSCFNHFIAFSQVSRSCQALSLFSLQRLPLALSLHRGARIKCSSRDSSSSFFSSSSSFYCLGPSLPVRLVILGHQSNSCSSTIARILPNK